MPESSAIAGTPSEAATWVAFSTALSRYVSPVSSTSGKASGSWFSTVTHRTGQSVQMRASSRSLCALREAIASCAGNAISTLSRAVIRARRAATS